MNKTEFISLLAQRMTCSKAQATRNLEAMIASMTAVLVQKERLILPGFATFGVKKRAARSGRNPSTGKTIQIPETQLPFIRVSDKIKGTLNAGKVGKTTQSSSKKK